MSRCCSKKIVCLIVSFLMLLAFSLPVYAGTPDSVQKLADFEAYLASIDNPVDPFENVMITSGITKPIESTFDTMRTIVGTAPKDTKIGIALYRYDNQTDEFVFLFDYETTVGQSCMFSKTIDLELGRNFISVTVTSGDSRTVQNAMINRKDLEIKKELEQGTVLHGKNFIYPLPQVKPPSNTAKP